MLKYKHIIENLTDSQKISLLTDIHNLSENEFKAMGIPGIIAGYMCDYCCDEFPSAVNLANSWDRKLIRLVAKETYRSMAREGVNHFVVPGPKVRISPYRSLLSDDPYLASQISGQYLKAAEQMNLCASMSELSITHEEVEWLDDEPDVRVLAEYVVDPYRRAARMGKCRGVYTENKANSEQYNKINISLSDAVSEGMFGEEKIFSLCRKVPSDEAVSYLANKRVCMSSSGQALTTALNRYSLLVQAISDGRASVGELEAEMEKGKAMSPELLDEAVDRLLDFAFSCNREAKLDDPELRFEKYLSKRAARESTVLLKNSGKILPISCDKNISVIGDIFATYNGQPRNAERLLEYIDRRQAKGKISKKIVKKPAVFARGYDIALERSEDHLTEAYRTAMVSDRVIIFVGSNMRAEKEAAKCEKLTLPANQQALLESLREFGYKTVVVVSGNYAVDVSFAKYYAGVIFAPLNTKMGVIAAIDVALGVFNPCGKLAATLYSDTDYAFKKQKSYRQKWNMKAGRFIGYRYYDSADMNVGFPFGHGLSYTKFEYSNPQVVDGEIIFDVKNCGKRGGVEVAQVYMGSVNSSELRPKKELVGFSRVELAPGETATVRIQLKVPVIYDVKANHYVTEKGNYKVYVGSSVSDIRLETSVVAGENELAPCNENLSDYLESETNILTDNYTLEARYKRMKRSIKNLVFGIVAIVLAISIEVYCAVAYNEAVFLDVLAGILIAGAIVMFVWDYIDKKAEYKKHRALIDKVNEQSFGNADEMPIYSAPQMFVQEFDVTAREGKLVNNPDENVDNEYFKNINKDLTFVSACSEFEAFARERGYVFTPETVKEIFAAFSASRLIMVKGMDNDTFTAFVAIVSEYFGGKLRVDSVNESYINEEFMLFGHDEADHRYKRNALLAMESADRFKYDIFIAALTDVKFEFISNYFVPFARYIRNPNGTNSVLAMNERHISTAYNIPRNLWFILNLDGGETLDNIPEYISDIATVNTFEFEFCEPEHTQTDVTMFKYPQIEYLENKNKALSEIDEDTWKKFDKFKDFVNYYTPYSVSNKLWTSLEKYVATYIACDGDRHEAIDKAIAYKLIPSVMSALKDCEFEEGKDLVSTLDRLFGEENTAYSRKMIQLALTVFEYEEYYEEMTDGEYVEGVENVEEGNNEYSYEDTFADLPEPTDVTAEVEDDAEEETAYEDEGEASDETSEDNIVLDAIEDADYEPVDGEKEDSVEEDELDVEEIDQDALFEEELTEDEIEEAEKFEDENRDIIENAPALEVDGKFAEEDEEAEVTEEENTVNDAE